MRVLRHREVHHPVGEHLYAHHSGEIVDLAENATHPQSLSTIGPEPVYPDSADWETMRRRDFLRTGVGFAGSAAIAGCTGLFETRSASALEEPPLVENRPNAVYYPTHFEGMVMADMADTKEYKVALMYSFPHRFWTVNSQNTNKVSIQDDDSVHFMGTLWDKETKMVLPYTNFSVELTQDGESVTERSLWPMLTQPMAFHFGDNVSLPDDGTYSATVRIGAIQPRRTGRFEGKFGEPTTVDMEFEYSQVKRDEIMVTQLDDKAGKKGAVEPMDMDMPLAVLPPKEDLPGQVLGEATSGDGVFIVTALDDADRFTDNDQTYLAVSGRTPYNRVPLPFMSLSATLNRDGETVFDGALQSTLDPELDYHYGSAVESIESGDTLTISVDAPPQTSRHEGYETAFLEMPPMELTIP